MKKYVVYVIMMIIIVLAGFCSAIAYYYYNGLDKDEDNKFGSLITSISDVKKDEVLYVKVIIDSMNVRKTNVVTTDNKVGEVEYDDIYQVKDIKKGATFYWYYIVDAEGNVGYIPSGSDDLYVETFKLKNDVEKELSTIKDYLATEDDPVNIDDPDNPTTTTTVPVTTPTTTNNQTNKTTTKTTKATKTTKSTTTSSSTTVITHTQTIPGTTSQSVEINLNMVASYKPECDMTTYQCIYTFKVEANATGIQNPKYIIKVFKDGKLVKSNSNYKNTLQFETDPGKYHVEVSLEGINILAQKDITVNPATFY